MESQETLSPICRGCGLRAPTEPHDTGLGLWAKIPCSWLVGLHGKSLVFACSSECAGEADDLKDRTARVSAPYMAA
jgi:hypothetical protein